MSAGRSLDPTDAWGEVADAVAPGVKVVALGGGHGLAASLTALRTLCDDLTAVVTVADNGGSSGRLRSELGVLPPGDLRQALAALCRDDEWGRTWAKVLQHRFAGHGDLHEHAVGNLLIVALWELLGGHVEGLDWVGRLLGAQGRVLPMAAVPLDIVADVRGVDPSRPDELTRVQGQVEVATTAGQVESVRLLPDNPPACPEALHAIRSANWVIFGPGSWYTSVLPHLLVPDLHTALIDTPAKRCVTLNLAPQAGETDGFSANTYLEVLAVHAPDLQVDVVLVDGHGVGEMPMLEETVNGLGADLVIADVAVGDGMARHDPAKLAAAYARIMR
ncbi:MAG: uridine diphosphate-N-acetylglucosamine-binding protein YvcK [Actinomycetota bacterium]|nr:uridine diphosphate-N-acetylglucosamine-binding protein YvcK [Actinomycetota bacterium]